MDNRAAMMNIGMGMDAQVEKAGFLSQLQNIQSQNEKTLYRIKELVTGINTKLYGPYPEKESNVSTGPLSGPDATIDGQIHQAHSIGDKLCGLETELSNLLRNI